MQTAELNQRFANEYLSTLRNRDVPHGRIYIIFSGVPGSGKTTLAKHLADDLKAQYIRHDDIRELIRRDGFNVADFTISHISAIVIDTILEKDANKFIVIDASLDRSWPRFFEHASQQQARPIVIRLNVSKDTIQKRIAQREEGHVGKVQDIDMYFDQFENSKREVKADIELSEKYEYSDVLGQVTELLS
jgi:predicted kinase